MRFLRRPQIDPAAPGAATRSPTVVGGTLVAVDELRSGPDRPRVRMTIMRDAEWQQWVSDMGRGANPWSVLWSAGALLAGGLVVTGIVGAFLCSTALWLVGMRGALTLLGIMGVAYGIAVGRAWLSLRRHRHDATYARSDEPLPLPADLLPAQDTLLRLDFIRIGQTESRKSGLAAPEIYEVFAAPSDPRIVAQLSFTALRTTLTSYLPDGRVIETSYPPVGLADVKVPKGWQLLPEWLQANECAEGIEPALKLHQHCLAAEAARWCHALLIPGFLTAVHWENLALQRLQVFAEHRLWLKTRNVLWIVPASVVAFCLGVLATWR
jgi:hypothetical protein